VRVLVEVIGEQHGVGGLADEVALARLQLGGTHVGQHLHDPAVGLCTFGVHQHISSRR
jgi:hypothetical protein